MGNDQSHHSHSHRHGEDGAGSHHHRQHPQGGHQANTSSPPVDQRFLKAFNSLSDGRNSIGLEQIKAKLGPLLGQSLWRTLNEDNREKEMSQDQFVRHADALIGITSDGVARILMPPQNLIETCLEADGILVKTTEERTFIKALLIHMTRDGDGTDPVIAWKNANCVRMCQPPREKINSIFYGNHTESVKINSEVLNPVQMFILRKSLPTTIFYPKPAHTDPNTIEADWILLYSSQRDGLSTNRFETKVFDYRGPTVAMFCLTSNVTYAIAADEEWRHATKPFGGTYAMLYQFSPKFDRIESPPPAIYCNFKQRSSGFGISYGRISLVDANMSNVQRMEVWGCAGSDTLQQQNSQKQRHQMQAERNAKVPMPGKWDGDKAILEMAGFKFSHERRD